MCFFVASMWHNDAVRHQMSVASHTETPIGVSKWLELEWGVRGKPAVGRRYYAL